MPDGTISAEYSEPMLLKSLPPDGFICVRPMPFGRMLKRRDTASKMSMEGNVKDEKSKINIETMQYYARAQEFAYCIGDHNITNKHGQKLDFGNSMSLDVLSPKLGAEIEAILDDINGEDEEEADFTMPAPNSSEDKSPQSTLFENDAA